MKSYRAWSIVLVLSALWASRSPATAQVTMPAPPMAIPRTAPQSNDGITVRGSGTANVQATTATLTLFVGTRNNAQSVTAATLSPIVDALVRAGVPRNDIALPIYLSPAARTNNATVTATIHNPTAEMVQNGIASLSGSSPLAPDLYVNSAQVRLTTDDCADAIRQAQAAALRQARENAQSIAQQIGKHVGAVLAVDTQNAPYTADGQCSSGYSIGPFQNMQFTSPEDYLRVRVYASVTMRFAIR